MLRFLICLTLLQAFTLPLAPIAAQSRAVNDANTAMLRVRVVDSASGAPIAGAFVRHPAVAWFDRTNAAGEHRSDRAPLVATLEVRCPTTKRLTGRTVYRKEFQLRAGSDTLLEIRVGLPGCTEPPVDTVAGEFRGHYTSGFENMRFSSCDGPPRNENFYGNPGTTVYLVDETLYQRLRWPKPQDPFTRYAYIRARGRLIGPGIYGHMGTSSHVLMIDTILEMRRARESDCRRKR